MDFSFRRLRAVIAVAECRSVAQAARRMNISQPAVTKSVREVERQLGVPLFNRSPGGMTPTAAGEILVRRARLALAELHHAEEEVGNLRGGASGRVAIGALPFARTRLVPLAVTRLAQRHPGLEIAIIDGEFTTLREPLRSGDVDFVVGATRDTPLPPDLSHEILFQDSIALVVRNGHPLSGRTVLAARDLSGASWVLPPRTAPMRRLFEQLRAAEQWPEPASLIETPSLATMRGLLLESDRIGVISRHRVFYEESTAQLEVLPVDLRKIARPIGIIMRASRSMSPGGQILLSHIRIVAAEIARQGGSVPQRMV